MAGSLLRAGRRGGGPAPPEVRVAAVEQDAVAGVEARATEDFYCASPVHYLPQCGGEALDRLRQRFVLLASGRGRAEDIHESWRAASLLGRKGVPNRDDWGEEWRHDWPTWRHMLLRYLDELLPAP